MMKFWIRLLAALFLSAAVAGCGGSSNALPTEDRVAEMNLEQVADMLREYQMNHGGPPKTLKQLRANPGGSLGGFELVDSGDIIVNLGAKLPDTQETPGASPDEEILAYGKDVPTQGGPVLLLNRTIRTMTPEEFKAAPQAKGSAQAKSDPKSK